MLFYNLLQQMYFIPWKWWLFKMVEPCLLYLPYQLIDVLIAFSFGKKVKDVSVLSNIPGLIVVDICSNKWNTVVTVVWKTSYQKPTHLETSNLTYFRKKSICNMPLTEHILLPIIGCSHQDVNSLLIYFSLNDL